MRKRSLAITAKWVEQVRQECGMRNSGLLVSSTPIWLKLLLRCFPRLVEEIMFRSKTIDAKVDSLIQQKSVSQVIEFAAGYSQRGIVFVEKYPNLIYIETDLPEVINSKREMIKSRKNNHILKYFDIINDEILFDQYICNQKTIMIAEGVMLYLREKELLHFLEKINKFLHSKGGGYFIFDAMHWEDETLSIRSMRKILVPLLRLENVPWPNFKDYNDGKSVLETIGFHVAGYERKGKIHIYAAATSR